MLASIEAATRRKLPVNFGATLAAATLARLRAELRAMPHAAHALTWLRGPKCVASSSPPDRVRASLETAGLARFFNFLFSASDVRNGKPAPDLFLHAASRMGVQATDCIVVEDSPAGVAAATAAGMTALGFVGGSHAGAHLGEQLSLAGARTIVAALRHLKSAVVALLGWCIGAGSSIAAVSPSSSPSSAASSRSCPRSRQSRHRQHKRRVPTSVASGTPSPPRYRRIGHGSGPAQR